MGIDIMKRPRAQLVGEIAIIQKWRTGGSTHLLPGIDGVEGLESDSIFRRG
jgi:hypothetical protein